MDDDREGEIPEELDEEEMHEEGIPVPGESLFADEDEVLEDDDLKEGDVPEGFSVEEEQEF